MDELKRCLVDFKDETINVDARINEFIDYWDNKQSNVYDLVLFTDRQTQEDIYISSAYKNIDINLYNNSLASTKLYLKIVENLARKVDNKITVDLSCSFDGSLIVNNIDDIEIDCEDCGVCYKTCEIKYRFNPEKSLGQSNDYILNHYEQSNNGLICNSR